MNYVGNQDEVECKGGLLKVFDQGSIKEKGAYKYNNVIKIGNRQ